MVRFPRFFFLLLPKVCDCLLVFLGLNCSYLYILTFDFHNSYPLGQQVRSVIPVLRPQKKQKNKRKHGFNPCFLVLRPLSRWGAWNPRDPWFILVSQSDKRRRSCGFHRSGCVIIEVATQKTRFLVDSLAPS